MKIGVVGAGQMGGGIAQSAAQAGYTVTNVDEYAPALENAKHNVRSGMEKLVSRNKISADQAADITARITYGADIQLLADCDVVIEAVPEKLELKRELFARLDRIVKPEGLLASNTSALSISAISAAMNNPQRCVGMHFFFPAPVMKLMEVTKGCSTTQEVEQRAVELAKQLGKEPVISPELPGFLVNRMLVPMQNEAAYLVMEGAAPKDVDTAMKLACNHPMGPLELTDFVGVDVMYNTMVALYDGFRDSKYRPCPLLANMVAAGLLGRKVGRGFYTYP